MTDGQRDTRRILDAARAIFDGRSAEHDLGAILTTLEGVVSCVLLAVMQNDPRKAAGMLNEGLVPGVESRLASTAAARAQKGRP